MYEQRRGRGMPCHCLVLEVNLGGLGIEKQPGRLVHCEMALQVRLSLSRGCLYPGPVDRHRWVFGAVAEPGVGRRSRIGGR